MPSTHKGFTLVELMITMAILSVIAAMAIPAYNGYIKTAKMTEAQNNLGALRLAQEEFFLENNNYFEGIGHTAIGNNSGGLWSRTAGKDGYNFDYAVTLSGTAGYTATASGLGETVIISNM